jgi:hypothetical protein
MFHAGLDSLTIIPGADRSVWRYCADLDNDLACHLLYISYVLAGGGHHMGPGGPYFLGDFLLVPPHSDDGSVSEFLR